jgi:hypothetical protein
MTGLRGGELADLGGAAEGEEAAVAKGERLDLRPGVIDGVDGAVEQHQIGVGVSGARFGSAGRPTGQAEGGGQGTGLQETPAGEGHDGFSGMTSSDGSKGNSEEGVTHSPPSQDAVPGADYSRSEGNET